MRPFIIIFMTTLQIVGGVAVIVLVGVLLYMRRR